MGINSYVQICIMFKLSTLNEKQDQLHSPQKTNHPQTHKEIYYKRTEWPNLQRVPNNKCWDDRKYFIHRSERVQMWV